MKFLYTATDGSGHKSQGQIQAPTKQKAVEMLKKKKLTLTSLSRLDHGTQIYIGGISVNQKIVFTKHLAVMLRAGVGLGDALETLAQESKGKMQEVLTDVQKRVVGGMSLADSLEKHSDVFNQYFISMVRTGETSGNLIEDLEQLSTRYAKDHELVSKVRGQLLYPGIVLGLAVILGMVISIFVFPKLITLFKSLRYDLPWYTKAMISVAQFLQDYGVLAIIGLIVFVALFIYVSRKPFARPTMHNFYARIPILGGIIHTVNMARFSMIFGSMLKSGIPIGQALNITGNLLGNEVYKKELLEAVPRVKAGEPFSSVIEESPLFPPFTTRILVIGEQTGTLTDMLTYLSSYYENELDTTLRNLSTILEPALIVFIGLIVLGVALSIVTPIYNFIGIVS